MPDQNFSLSRIEMSNDYIVDFVSFLVPCQRFRIRAIITKDAQTSLATEFALRFLNTIGKTTIDNSAAFFGFAPSEVRVLTADLIRSGFVRNYEGLIELTRKGQALFADSKDIVNLIEYDDFNNIVGFDLIAFCLAEELGTMPSHFKALEELPIQNRERASQAYKIVREEVFEKHFHEYYQRYKDKKHNEHMQLHSITEVEPKARFNTELTIPIQLSFKDSLKGSLQAKPNFSALTEKGRWESRGPLIAIVNQRLASVKATEDSQAAIEFIAKFDKGLLSGDPSSENFDPIRWIQQTLSGRVLKNNYQPYVPLVGSCSTQQVREVISDWTKNFDFPPREQNIPLLWIRPSIPHWGRNADFFGLLSVSLIDMPKKEDWS